MPRIHHINPLVLLSVIIPTCDRPDALARCLDLLAPEHQQIDPNLYEVIVTDDGHRSPAQTLVQNRSSRFRVTPGPRRGPAANRNHAAKIAHGTWLAFLDDDCEPDSRWLRSILNLIQDQPPDIIEGKTVCPNKQDNPFQEHIENLQGGLYWSCNITIRRAAFEQLGSFDEDFLEPGGEDMELAWRIQNQKLTCRFAPDVLVIHPPRRIDWGNIWWRTWLLRWILLYRIKTRQSPPLSAGALQVGCHLIKQQTLDLARTTTHVFTRFNPDTWRSCCFFQTWKWLTFPLVLPYLLHWEFRFRALLTQRPTRQSLKPL